MNIDFDKYENHLVRLQCHKEGEHGFEWYGVILEKKNRQNPRWGLGAGTKHCTFCNSPERSAAIHKTLKMYFGVAPDRNITIYQIAENDVSGRDIAPESVERLESIVDLTGIDNWAFRLHLLPEEYSGSKNPVVTTFVEEKELKKRMRTYEGNIPTKEEGLFIYTGTEFHAFIDSANLDVVPKILNDLKNRNTKITIFPFWKEYYEYLRSINPTLKF